MSYMYAYIYIYILVQTWFRYILNVWSLEILIYSYYQHRYLLIPTHRHYPSLSVCKSSLLSVHSGNKASKQPRGRWNPSSVASTTWTGILHPPAESRLIPNKVQSSCDILRTVDMHMILMYPLLSEHL